MPPSSKDGPRSSARRPSVEQIQGVIEHLALHVKEMGYVQASLRVPGESELVSVVGNFYFPGEDLDVSVGQTLLLNGFWRRHPKDGRQFQVVHAKTPGGVRDLPTVDQALDTKEAARRLGCSHATIQKLVATGELKAYTADPHGRLMEPQPEEKRQEYELYILVRDVETYGNSGLAPEEGWFPLHIDEEPKPMEGSETLLSRVRSMSTIWKSLQVRNVGTRAYALSGRLSLFVDISDRTPYFVEREGWIAGVALAELRIDHLGTSISTGWVSASSEYFEPVANASPKDGITIPVDLASPTAGTDEAVAWLAEQLRRPVQRFEWTRDGKTVARHWMLADTGRGLVVSGPPAIWRDPQTATTVFQVRP